MANTTPEKPTIGPTANTGGVHAPTYRRRARLRTNGSPKRRESLHPALARVVSPDVLRDRPVHQCAHEVSRDVALTAVGERAGEHPERVEVRPRPERGYKRVPWMPPRALQEQDTAATPAIVSTAPRRREERRTASRRQPRIEKWSRKKDASTTTRKAAVSRCQSHRRPPGSKDVYRSAIRCSPPRGGGGRSRTR